MLFIISNLLYVNSRRSDRIPNIKIEFFIIFFSKIGILFLIIKHISTINKISEDVREFGNRIINPIIMVMYI